MTSWMKLLRYGLAEKKPLNGLHHRWTLNMGILKKRVYSQGVCTKAELREKIIAKFASLDNNKALCWPICDPIKRRIQLCNDSEGQHFED